MVMVVVDAPFREHERDKHVRRHQHRQRGVHGFRRKSAEIQGMAIARIGGQHGHRGDEHACAVKPEGNRSGREQRDIWPEGGKAGERGRKRGTGRERKRGGRQDGQRREGRAQQRVQAASGRENVKLLCTRNQIRSHSPVISIV